MQTANISETLIKKIEKIPDFRNNFFKKNENFACNKPCEALLFPNSKIP